MKWMALVLLAVPVLCGEQQRIVLLEELVRLEAMERKTIVQFPLEQQDAQLEVKFASKRGGEGVSMAVYSAGTRQPLAETKYELTDTLRLPLTREREYRVELQNQRQRLGHALVDVEVTLVFGRPDIPPPSAARTLEPERKLYTILSSLTLFAMIVAYSAIRLTPPILERLRGQR